MNERTARIYFEGEAKKIGSGWRNVTIREGDKWAYLTNSTGITQRIPLTTLDAIEEQMEAMNHGL